MTSSQQEPDDFVHRRIVITQHLQSTRLDHQVQAFRSIENEFQEVEKSGFRNSIFSFFTRSDSPPPKVPHKIASHKELQQFLKSSASSILNIIKTCSHEELLRHAKPLVSRLSSLSLLPPNYPTDLYDNALRYNGAVALRAQDIIVSLFPSLSPTERSHFITTTITASENSDITALHFLCKQIQTTFPTSQIPQSLTLLIPHTDVLLPSLLPCAKQSSITQHLRRQLLQFLPNSPPHLLPSILQLLSQTAPFSNVDLAEINSVLTTLTLINFPPETTDSLMLLADSDENVFSPCISILLAHNNYSTITSFLKKWSSRRSEDIMTAIESIPTLPSAAHNLAIRCFIEYNKFVTNAIDIEPEKKKEKIEDFQLISFLRVIKFEALYGTSLIWKIALNNNDDAVELLTKLYKKNISYFVRDGIHAFIEDPKERGAHIVEKILGRYNSYYTSQNKTIQPTPARFCSLSRKIREKDEPTHVSLQMKTLSNFFIASQTTKATKVLVEEAEKDISRVWDRIDDVMHLSQKSYRSTEKLRVIVDDAIKDTLIYETASDHLPTTINSIKTGLFDVVVFIDGSEASLDKNIGYYVRHNADITFIVKKSDSPWIVVKSEATTTTVSTTSSEPPQDSTNLLQTLKIRGEVTKCAQQDIENLVDLLKVPKQRGNVLSMLRGIDSYIEWEGDPIELALTDGPKQPLGIARLETIKKVLTTEQFSKLLKTFCSLLFLGSSLSEMLASALLKNEEKNG
ncbi:Uncharacterized protein QTN25_001753 [Entamoeba marina]